ncbi:MAG: sulfite exporter TauE/SafE family protein [Proteobacteria bacterium]|nr:sulfite exporter TauE/SafE family protein [Pseudomonadota bacterium]
MSPELDVVAVLGAAAFATAVLSAVVGMAGGITLLAVMLLYLPPLVVIPLHGVVQLVSNGSRAFIQREHVQWGILLRYGILLVPAGIAGLAVARQVPPDATKLAIGVFVLLATWAPGVLTLGAHPEASDPNRRFFALGAVAGFLNVTVGAIGPLIAPFFLNLGLTRFALIGTKAACQMLGHLTKIALFGAVGFAFADHVVLLAVLSAAVVTGTWLGSRLLERVNERVFLWLYRVVLTAVALRLVVAGALRVAGV